MNKITAFQRARDETTKSKSRLISWVAGPSELIDFKQKNVILKYLIAEAP